MVRETKPQKDTVGFKSNIHPSLADTPHLRPMDNRISADCFCPSILWGPASDMHTSPSMSTPLASLSQERLHPLQDTNCHFQVSGLCVCRNRGRTLTLLGGQALQGSLQHAVTGPSLTPPQNKSTVFDPDSLLLPETLQHPVVQLTSFLWESTAWHFRGAMRRVRRWEGGASLVTPPGTKVWTEDGENGKGEQREGRADEPGMGQYRDRGVECSLTADLGLFGSLAAYLELL